MSGLCQTKTTTYLYIHSCNFVDHQDPSLALFSVHPHPARSCASQWEVGQTLPLPRQEDGGIFDKGEGRAGVYLEL